MVLPLLQNRKLSGSTAVTMMPRVIPLAVIFAIQLIGAKEIGRVFRNDRVAKIVTPPLSDQDQNNAFPASPVLVPSTPSTPQTELTEWVTPESTVSTISTAATTSQSVTGSSWSPEIIPLSGGVRINSAIVVPPTEDTVAVSAEVLERAKDIFETKCDNYYSQSTTTSSAPTFRVMVIGGTNSGQKEFPHMAALGFGSQDNKQWLCGGSLVSENYVITAAHCVSVESIGDVQFVKLGTLNLQQDTENTQEYTVIRRLRHPNFDALTQYNDLALLELDKPVTLTEYVTPICIFTSSDYGDKNLVATGWGKTAYSGGGGSADLQKVGLELFEQRECQTAYREVSKRQLPKGIVEDEQICAGSRTQSKDTCQGDSGGPLQIRSNNRWYLVGITSFGIECGNINVPGVYTRVSHYTRWIRETIWNTK